METEHFIDLEKRKPIVYKRCYVAFLDILGFKDLVNSSEKSTIENYFGIVDSAIQHLRSILNKQYIQYINISDSVILSVEHGKDKDENFHRLQNLCIAVGLIQSSLALKNIWLRGGISSGEAFFNQYEYQVVGRAYIEAYLLEQQTALYPRIVIDGKIIQEFEFKTAKDFIEKMNDKKRGGLQYSNWGKTIIFDWYSYGDKLLIKQDVSLFIDYLSFFFEAGYIDENNYLDKIVSGLEENLYKSANTYVKYRWVLNYLKTVSNKVEVPLRIKLAGVIRKINSL